MEGCANESGGRSQPSAATMSPRARRELGTSSEVASPNWRTVGAAFERPFVLDAPLEEVEESVVEVVVPVASTVDPAKGVVAVFVGPRILLPLTLEAVGWALEAFEG